jgi:hypothetical protein
LTRDFERKLRFCFIRRLIFSGLQELCKRRLWKWTSLSIGPPLGGGAHLLGTPERQMKEGSGNGASLSMEALPGEPGGRTPLVGTLKDWRWTSLTIEAPLGNLDGRLVYWRLPEVVKDGSGNTASVCMVALQGECGGRASLLGNLKDA